MNNKLEDKNLDFLFKAVLALETREECYDFFEDLCTVQELKALSQRIVVAKMLSEKCVYTDIVNEIRSAYTSEKSAKKAELMDRYR